MPDGGTLVIEAVPCTKSDHADCIALSVTDTGQGIAPDVLGNVFEPFFSTRLLNGGSGLGLYNVQAFAGTLGGSVEISSREKEGTRVVLHLPLAQTARRWHRC
jgi:signal transduction histidine kinase